MGHKCVAAPRGPTTGHHSSTYNLNQTHSIEKGFCHGRCCRADACQTAKYTVDRRALLTQSCCRCYFHTVTVAADDGTLGHSAHKARAALNYERYTHAARSVVTAAAGDRPGQARKDGICLPYSHEQAPMIICTATALDAHDTNTICSATRIASPHR